MTASSPEAAMDFGPVGTAFSEISRVEVDGQLLRVARRRIDGGGIRPLLIFNGIGAKLELLEPFVEALEKIEIVTFDAPGVGGSPTRILPYRYQDLARLADGLMHKLGYGTEIDVLGVSWGGALAQQHAYFYPERCRRLILAGTSTGAIMIPGRLSLLRRLLDPRRHHDRNYFKRIAPELYGGTLRGDPDVLDDHFQHIGSPYRIGYVYQLLTILSWTSLPWLHRLSQQTLIIAGRDDPVVPLLNAKILKLLIPRSELVIVEDAHLFLTTSARTIAPVVQRFLTETPV
jgi:poly(3-hydroxyalkanoate) depolymerase